MGKNEPDHISLTYQLDELPTAQHRAGLAGLLFQIDVMKTRKKPQARIPKVASMTSTSVELTFSKENIQGVLDDLYEARSVEIATPTKWKGAEPLREQTVEQTDRETGKKKIVKQFVYEVVQPQNPSWELYLNGPEDHPWLKLWRDMIWAVPRGINTTRAPFNQRARKEPCSEANVIWQLLCADATLRANGSFKTQEISSALMLSAQAINAELVPFLGRADQSFLLHFWQIVVLMFVPQTVSNDGQYESRGFVLAVPDVCDLKGFLEVFPMILHDDLGRTRRGYRPADALIDIPAQANLEFLRHLRPLGTSKSAAEQWSFCVRAVESFHMAKSGNTVKLLAFDRTANRPELISEYERLNASYCNPLFRFAVLTSLLRDEPWYSNMLEAFAERPWSMFVESEKTPRKVPRFGTDARKKFRAIFKDTRDMDLQEINQTDRLSRIIHRLVNKYVEGRAESKTGKKVKDFAKHVIDGKERREYPKEFREAQQRVCSEAFLAMRSRHDQDFVTYFVGSICSVAQYLPPSDYQFLTSVLLTKSDPSPAGTKALSWEDVKAVAMVAVSACSYVTQPRNSETTRSNA